MSEAGSHEFSLGRRQKETHSQIELAAGGCVRNTCSAAKKLHRRGDCKFITSLIFRVSGMSANKSKSNLVLVQKLIQLLPQLDIFDGLPGCPFFSCCR